MKHGIDPKNALETD